MPNEINTTNETLTIITEGGRHMIAYLLANNVKADTFILETVKFQEFLPYTTKDDKILLIIKGLTDFTMVEIYNIVNKILEVEEAKKNLVIMSNIDLGKIQVPYYLYSGDLFYGNVELVDGGKKYKLDTQGQIRKDTESGNIFDKIARKQVDEINKNKTRINPIMSKFTKFDTKRPLKKGRMYIYDAVKHPEIPYKEPDEFNKIVAVDLFK